MKLEKIVQINDISRLRAIANIHSQTLVREWIMKYRDRLMKKGMDIGGQVEWKMQETLKEKVKITLKIELKLPLTEGDKF